MTLGGIPFTVTLPFYTALLHTVATRARVPPPIFSPKKAESSAIPTKTPLRRMSPTKNPAKLMKEGARGPKITAAKMDSKTSRPPTVVQQSTSKSRNLSLRAMHVVDGP
jgi:hypothetical protein